MMKLVRPAHELIQRVLHEAFALAVERARRLVEDQDGGVFQDGARDGDALTLAAGELDAAFAHERLVALREPVDEVVRVGLARGVDDFLAARAGAAIGNVFRDAAAEEEDFLRHDGHLSAQGAQGIFRRRTAVEQESARFRVIEAQEQGNERGLPAPLGPTSATRSPGAACRERSWMTVTSGREG